MRISDPRVSTCDRKIPARLAWPLPPSRRDRAGYSGKKLKRRIRIPFGAIADRCDRAVVFSIPCRKGFDSGARPQMDARWRRLSIETDNRSHPGKKNSDGPDENQSPPSVSSVCRKAHWLSGCCESSNVVNQYAASTGNGYLTTHRSCARCQGFFYNSD